MTTETVRRAEHVDESGWLVKGHGLTEAQLEDSLEAWERYTGNPPGNILAWYERSEIWVRKFNQPKLADYAWLMQETEPHARGAGRFTFIDENHRKGEQHRHARPLRYG